MVQKKKCCIFSKKRNARLLCMMLKLSTTSLLLVLGPELVAAFLQVHDVRPPQPLKTPRTPWMGPFAKESISHLELVLQPNERSYDRQTIVLNASKKKTAGGSSGPKKTTKSSSNAKKLGSDKPNKNNSNKPDKKSAAGPTSVTSRQQRTPPWQVLSKKDAKKNVEIEKKRREDIKQGIISPAEGASEAFLSVEEEDAEPIMVSKTFLSHVEKRFLGWKRFNPSSTSSGMRFVASVLEKQMLPRVGVPEVAFLGRSNVGKSSLLNRLSSFSKKEAGFNDEARIGKTPGATASVNLYAFYDKKEKPLLGFVDLPGFGFAKLSKDTKESVQLAAERYLGRREELVLGVLLVDIRREPSEDDRIVLAALYDMGVPIVVVATKIDKVSKTELENQLEKIRIGLGLPDGQPFCVSSVTGEGTKALWNLILEACEIGVEDFRKKLERGNGAEKTNKGVVATGDDDGEVYSQGYDWIQGDAIYAESDNNIYDEGDYYGSEEEAESTGNASNDASVKRESLKDLKRKARRMERDGNV